MNKRRIHDFLRWSRQVPESSWIFSLRWNPNLTSPCITHLPLHLFTHLFIPAPKYSLGSHLCVALYDLNIYRQLNVLCAFNQFTGFSLIRLLIRSIMTFPQINFPQTFLLCLSSSLSTFSRVRWADWSVIRSELDCEEWGGFRFRGKKSFLDFCCCCYSANLHTRGSRPATAQFWIYCCLTQLKFQTFCSSWEQSRWKQRTGHAVLTYEWNWNTLEFCRVTDLQVS